MALFGDDCYFFYYSTCNKGDACPFRHVPDALGKEDICPKWKFGRCVLSSCPLRHMIIEKARNTTQCYWETQLGGCQKPHCVFLHIGHKSGPNSGYHAPPVVKIVSQAVPTSLPATRAPVTAAENPIETGGGVGAAAPIQTTPASDDRPVPAVESAPYEGAPRVAAMVINPSEEESDNESSPSSSPVKQPQASSDPTPPIPLLARLGPEAVGSGNTSNDSVGERIAKVAGISESSLEFGIRSLEQIRSARSKAEDLDLDLIKGQVAAAEQLLSQVKTSAPTVDVLVADERRVTSASDSTGLRRIVMAKEPTIDPLAREAERFIQQCREPRRNVIASANVVTAGGSAISAPRKDSPVAEVVKLRTKVESPAASVVKLYTNIQRSRSRSPPRSHSRSPLRSRSRSPLRSRSRSPYRAPHISPTHSPERTTPLLPSSSEEMAALKPEVVKLRVADRRQSPSRSPEPISRRWPSPHDVRPAPKSDVVKLRVTDRRRSPTPTEVKSNTKADVVKLRATDRPVRSKPAAYYEDLQDMAVRARAVGIKSRLGVVGITKIVFRDERTASRSDDDFRRTSRRRLRSRSRDKPRPSSTPPPAMRGGLRSERSRDVTPDVTSDSKPDKDTPDDTEEFRELFGEEPPDEEKPGAVDTGAEREERRARKAAKRAHRRRYEAVEAGDEAEAETRHRRSKRRAMDENGTECHRSRRREKKLNRRGVIEPESKEQDSGAEVATEEEEEVAVEVKPTKRIVHLAGDGKEERAQSPSRKSEAGAEDVSASEGSDEDVDHGSLELLGDEELDEFDDEDDVLKPKPKLSFQVKRPVDLKVSPDKVKQVRNTLECRPRRSERSSRDAEPDKSHSDRDLDRDQRRSNREKKARNKCVWSEVRRERAKEALPERAAPRRLGPIPTPITASEPIPTAPRRKRPILAGVYQPPNRRGNALNTRESPEPQDPCQNSSIKSRLELVQPHDDRDMSSIDQTNTREESVKSRLEVPKCRDGPIKSRLDQTNTREESIKSRLELPTSHDEPVKSRLEVTKLLRNPPKSRDFTSARDDVTAAVTRLDEEKKSKWGVKSYSEIVKEKQEKLRRKRVARGSLTMPSEEDVGAVDEVASSKNIPSEDPSVDSSLNDKPAKRFKVSPIVFGSSEPLVNSPLKFAATKSQPSSIHSTSTPQTKVSRAAPAISPITLSTARPRLTAAAPHAAALSKRPRLREPSPPVPPDPAATRDHSPPSPLRITDPQVPLDDKECASAITCGGLTTPLKAACEAEIDDEEPMDVSFSSACHSPASRLASVTSSRRDSLLDDEMDLLLDVPTPAMSGSAALDSQASVGDDTLLQELEDLLAD